MINTNAVDGMAHSSYYQFRNGVKGSQVAVDLFNLISPKTARSNTRSKNDGYLDSKFCNDRCMVARFFASARFLVDPAAGAFFGEGGRNPNVVDPETLVSLPRT